MGHHVGGQFFLEHFYETSGSSWRARAARCSARRQTTFGVGILKYYCLYYQMQIVKRRLVDGDGEASSSILLLVVAKIVRRSRLQLLMLAVLGHRSLLLHVLVRRHGHVLVPDGRLLVLVLLLVWVLLVFERVLERVGRLFGGLRFGGHRRRLHVFVRRWRGQVLVARRGRLLVLTVTASAGMLQRQRLRQRNVLVGRLRLFTLHVLVLRKKRTETHISYR